MEELADRLIERVEACSPSEVGAVYRFLLSALRGDEREARAEFVRYLKGELSPQMLTLARSATRSVGVYPLASDCTRIDREAKFPVPA
jgi:hypothetical protein